MGLRDKAQQLSATQIGKETVEIEYNNYDFILNLFKDNDISIQINKIINFLSKKLKTNRILINFFNENENIYQVLGIKDIPEEEQRYFDIDYDDNFLKEVRGPVQIKELLNEPKFKEELSKFTQYNFKVIIPLFSQEELKGFITLGNKINNESYTFEDINEINQLGNIISIVLYNSYCLDIAQRRINQSQISDQNSAMLIENLRNIRLAENLEEAIVILFKIIKDYYKINIANLLIEDKKNGDYKTLKSIGLTTETDKLFCIKKEDDFFMNIIELGESMMIPDFENLDVFKNTIINSDKSKIKMFYSVPLNIGKECLGFFNVFNIEDGSQNQISSDIERILATLPLSILPYIIYELK